MTATLRVIAGHLADQAQRGPTERQEWDGKENGGVVVAGVVILLGIACAVLAIAGLLYALSR